MKLNTKQEGWVIINIGHPIAGRNYIAGYTFSSTREEAIEAFIGGTKDKKWRYWRETYNFRCVRATLQIECGTAYLCGNIRGASFKIESSAEIE